MCSTTLGPRFYRFPDLVAMFACGETKTRELTGTTDFPAPYQLGGSGPYLWKRAEVDAYIETLAPVAPEARLLSDARRAAQERGRAHRRASSRNPTVAPVGALPELVPAGATHDDDGPMLLPAERGRRRSRS